MFEKLIPNAAACFNKDTFEDQSQIADELGFMPDLESYKSGRCGMNHSVHILNLCGYCPVVSTFTGSFRALVGAAYLIKSVACCIFDSPKRAYHVEGIKIAAANIGRGLLEAIPVIGNIFAANIDISRMLHRWADYCHDNDDDLGPYPYGGGTLLDRFNAMDAMAIIPVVGTVVNLSRSIFFAAHALVNVPPALTGNYKYLKAVRFGLSEVGNGLVGSIPVVGFWFLFLNRTVL
jgi:hypothetical protein